MVRGRLNRGDLESHLLHFNAFPVSAAFGQNPEEVMRLSKSGLAPLVPSAAPSTPSLGIAPQVLTLRVLRRRRFSRDSMHTEFK